MKKKAIVFGAAGNLGPIWSDLLETAGYSVLTVVAPHDWEEGIAICDVREKATIEVILQEYGVPDLVVCNQAIDNPPGSGASLFGNAKEIIDVNLIGTANIIEVFAPVMAASGKGGNIVVVGSMLGFIASDPRIYDEGFDKPWSYGASKAGLWNLVKVVNMRYAIKGVVTNMIALSAVEGNQSPEFKERYCSRIPIGRMLRKEDFSREFLTVCQSSVPYGFPVLVDGGYTIW